MLNESLVKSISLSSSDILTLYNYIKLYKHLNIYSLLWSLWKMENCLIILLRKRKWFRIRLVKFFNKLLVGFSIFINWGLYIGILNWRIYWWIMIRLFGLLILGLAIRIRLRKDWRLHVGRLAMLPLKWSNLNILINLLWLIFGVLESSYTPWFVDACLLKTIKPQNCIKKS